MNGLLLGDVRTVLAGLEPRSVHLTICSPPFYAKRKYANADEQAVVWGDGSTCALGHEPTPDLFVAHLVECFAAVWRVLRDDGCCVVEIGDSYASQGAGFRPGSDRADGVVGVGKRNRNGAPTTEGIPAQTRIGVPERFALAMAAAGWRWRDSLIWRHTSAMPESVAGWSWQRCRAKVASNPNNVGERHPSKQPGGLDRIADRTGNSVFSSLVAQYADCPGCPKCEPNGGYVLRKGQWRSTVAHSTIFVFSKTAAYYGDGFAVRQPPSSNSHGGGIDSLDRYGPSIWGEGAHSGLQNAQPAGPGGANLRSVLSIGPEPFTMELCGACRKVYDRRAYDRLRRRDGKRVCGCGATEWVSHYATYPTKLPELFIRAFTSEAGVCAECGAPWARIMETRRNDPEQAERMAAQDVPGNPMFRGGHHNDGLPYDGETKTLGWRPTCSHGEERVAATVLDPFCGTGSTLVAAQRNGRDGIGVDVAQDYLDMAAARLAETQAALR